ncbi:MAG TPA: hypothetical protein VNQ77_07905 [Frankiaceae bacterium]|nr:hypothetical protein [Frankiaceae bacterium]
MGDGAYAGLAVWQLGGAKPTPYGGVLASRDMDAPTRPATLGVASAHSLVTPLPLGKARVTLAPGRYRFYLLAGGRAEIRLPLPPGATGRTIAATKTSRQRYSAQHKALGPAVTSAALRAPLTGGAGTKYYAFARVASGLTEDVRVTACLTGRAMPCAKGEYVTETSADGLTYWPQTSGVGVRGALLRRTTRVARAELDTATCAGCRLTLIVLAYDL